MQKRRANSQVFELTQKANELKKNQPEKALELLEKALKIDPRDPFIFGLMTQCHLNLNQAKYALESAQEGVKLAPLNNVGYGLLCKALLANNESEKAVKAAEKGVFLARYNPVQYGLLCKALLANNEIEKAIKAAEKCVNLAPNDPVSYALLTQVYLAGDDSQKALESIQTGVELANNEVTVALLAEVLRKSNEYQKALDVISGLPDTSWRKHLIRAYCCMHLNNFCGAFSAFQKAEKLFTEDCGDFNDSRIRIYAGYIFLFSFASENTEQEFKNKIIEKVRKSSDFLLSIDVSTVGRLQRHDFDCALEILKSLQKV